MRVWVVVQHYDRGSDEVCVEGVFSTETGAQLFVEEKFPRWEWIEDEIRPGYYAEPDFAEGSDYVFITEREVQP